jgi:putative FmdB family regulatory protein
MPIYDYKCPACGIEKMDVWAKIDETVLPCFCGSAMVRQIGATRSNPDWQPYFDENLAPMHGTGTVVKSRQHRKELMKRYHLYDKWSGC